jgi:VWFA-related protein
MQNKVWHSATALALVIYVAGPAGAQERRFEAGVYYVDVPVRVIDDKGSFASGLKIDDFTVSESGTPQTLMTFEEVHLGGRVAAGQKAREAATAASPAPPPEERAFYVVFDDYHLSREVSPKAGAAVRQFLEKQLLPGDLVGVAFTTDQRGQDLTADRAAVRDAIARLHGNNDPRDQPAVRNQWARNTLRSVSSVLQSKSLDSSGHHTALVLMTSGVDCVALQRARQDGVANCGPELQDVVKRAISKGVTIYAIDPLGAVTPKWESPATVRDGRNGPSLNGLELSRTSDKQDDAMRVLASETGGFTITNTEQLAPAFERIARETGSFYRLGYYSNNDRTYEKIGADIAVTLRRKGVTAFYPTSRPPVSAGAAAAPPVTPP